MLPFQLWGLLLAPPVLLLLLYAFQRHLLWPELKTHAVLAAPSHHIEAVEIPVGDRRLQGWRASPRGATGPTGPTGPAAVQTVRPPGHTPSGMATGALLYFNGRREHPTSIFRALAEMPGQEVLCWHYPGLGRRLRKPTEGERVADSLAVLDWWAAQCGRPTQAIDLAGRSLGSGLAVQVAAARPVRRLVLISPHDRLLSALQAHLPFWPARWMKDPYESRHHIARVKAPCLLVVGERDRTIPPQASRALFARWPGELCELALPDAGHRGLLRRRDVHCALARFLGHSPRSNGGGGVGA